jgi:hypothetical protein
MILALGVGFVVGALLLWIFPRPLDWLAAYLNAQSAKGASLPSPYFDAAQIAQVTRYSVRIGFPLGFLFSGTLCIVSRFERGRLPFIVFPLFAILFAASIGWVVIKSRHSKGSAAS